ncbi:YibE/F family protein, partial [Pediococcus acidilactici]|nr:YibE/F family protein [Pediococcus acidilactici]
MVSATLILMIILAVLMVIVGGATGLRAFLSIILNFAVLFVNIALISWGFPALTVTIISSLVILAITIFMGSDDDQITQNAFYSSVLVLVV